MRAAAERLATASLLLLLTPLAQAQTPLRVQAQLGSSLVVSDNLSAGSGDARDRGAVLTLSPGVTLSGRSAQTQGSLSYTAHALLPVRLHETPDRLQHSLNGNLHTRAGDSGFSLAAQASIGRQARSAFGTQRPGTRGVNPVQNNQAEVYAASVTPAWEGSLGELANWKLTHRMGLTNTRNSAVGDGNLRDTQLAITDASQGVLGWGLRASDSRNDTRAGRETSTQSVAANLNWRPDVDWQFGASAGRERSNLHRSQRQAGATYGLNASWKPTPRTSLNANAEERVFGNTHSLSLEHRFARASIRFSESRGVNQPGAIGAVGSRTYYELLFAQLAAVEPDPIARDALVRAQLQAMGLDPDGVPANGFISSRPSLTRMRALSGSWQTLRSSWTLSATRSINTRFGAAFEAFDDFADSNVLVLKAISLSNAYRLTPVSSLTTVLQWQRNTGERIQLNNKLRSASVSWNTSLGLQRQFSAQLRHTTFDSLLRPYEENAVVLTLQQQF